MDVFNLEARFGLNKREYDEGLRDAEREANTFSSRIQAGLNVAVRAIGAGIAAGAAGVAALTTQSVRQFSEFEQLVGGTELMFGEAYDYVMDRAQNAYSNVQMSQNQYLQQVNGFAIGLRTALGGNEQAAAELADRIVTAEADIVAATGNSQEAVQNAFNGIMRSNYTMLDNLQLGITPTREGMQEVIDTVNEWNETQGRVTEYTIDNIADVQSALIDYVEMQGLSGYASNEASETIQGSIASMKAAWQDLLVSFADPEADLSVRISNLVDTASTAFYNILPAALRAVSGIGTLIEQVAPMVEAQLPTLVDDLLPPVLNAAISLVEGVVNALPSILRAVTNALPRLFNQLVPAILRVLPQLVRAGMDLLNGLMRALAQAMPTLVPLITDAVIQIVEIITSVENMETLLECGLLIISAIGEGLAEAAPELAALVPQILANIAVALTDNSVLLVDTIISLGTSIGMTILGIIGSFMGLSQDEIQSRLVLVGNALFSFLSNAITRITNFFSNAKNYISSGISDISDFFADGIEFWRELFVNGFTAIRDFIVNGVNGWKNAISNAITAIRSFIIDGVNGWRITISSAIENIRSFFVNGVEGWKNTINTGLENIRNFFTNAKNNVISTVSSWVSSVVSYFNLSGAVTNVTNVLNSISSTFTSIFNTVRTTVYNAIEYVKGLFDFSWSLPSIALPHFSISGSLSLNPPSVPRVSVSWYKRGYEEAMLLDGATIFGMAGGRLLGGGEGNGSEAVVGTDLLMSMIGTVVDDRLSKLNLKVYLDTGELVGGIAPAMDGELGRLSLLNDKGAY